MQDRIYIDSYWDNSDGDQYKGQFVKVNLDPNTGQQVADFSKYQSNRSSET